VKVLTTTVKVLTTTVKVLTTTVKVLTTTVDIATAQHSSDGDNQERLHFSGMLATGRFPAQ
jgi:hypothetical protein